MTEDRFGIGWRPELAAGIFANLDHIEVVEVIADDYFGNSKRRLSPLRTLAAQVPLLLHGVTMGLASTVPVDERRLGAMARLVDAVRPEGWSEHLAFVRGGGVEIGHLAAPPRSTQTLEGASRNFQRAKQIVGLVPSMENVATLVDPPASKMEESAWLAAFATETNAPLLLDLHNLYANAVNFGVDPYAALARLPLERVSTIHLSGGHWIDEPTREDKPNRRLLDDHVHDVPDPVFGLLTAVAASTKQPFTVILERDGRYPPFSQLLAQLGSAREAVAAGRRIQ